MGSYLELISRLVQLGNIQFVRLHVCMTLCHVFHLDLLSIIGAVFNDTQDCLVTRLVIQICSLTKWKLRNRFLQNYRKKKARLTENKATVSSLLCFQCLLQASDGDFSISWWKWHFSICRCFLFDIMGRLFARGQTNPNHGFTTSRRFCLIFYSWRIVYFNVFREFVALSVQTHLLIKKTWRTFICSSPRIV